jgi:isocitrate dehydrogenase kinase/phosphatase
MSGNIQKSSSLNRIVEDITHVKQRLEYFERHIHNVRNEEIKKEYFRTLSKVLEAEVALSHFNNVFNDSNT